MRYLLNALVLTAVLTACVSTPAPKTSYNQGVEAFRSKDYRAAREHWAKAIDSGDISALNNLGYLLFYGLGGEQDHSQAIALWKKAAYSAHSEAQWHLGVAYERGEGVPENLEEAYAWYRCSVASAAAAPSTDEPEAEILKDASKSLAKLLGRLPPDRFANAEALAKKYVSQYSRRSAGA
jgi:TPR repeat protein